MCFAENVIHNLYSQHHSTSKFDEEVQEHLSASRPHINRQNMTTGTVHTLYDIRTVKICYGLMNYKRQKLADISLPPYIDENIYLKIINIISEYLTDKTFSILPLDNGYIYMYYKQECVNTLINNLIIYHTT